MCQEGPILKEPVSTALSLNDSSSNCTFHPPSDRLIGNSWLRKLLDQNSPNAFGLSFVVRVLSLLYSYTCIVEIDADLFLSVQLHRSNTES